MSKRATKAEFEKRVDQAWALLRNGSTTGEIKRFFRERVGVSGRLGHDAIPCTVVSTLEDATLSLQLEQEENECRLDPNPEEKVRLAKRLKPLLEAEAKKRKAEGNLRCGKSKKQVSGNLPPTSPRPRTRDALGASFRLTSTRTHIFR